MKGQKKMARGKAKSEAKTKKVIKAGDDAKSISRAMDAAPRRALKSRNTEEQVERCLNERFRSVPRSVLESKVCKDGQLLRPKLTHDFRRARKSGKRLGANYYRELEAWFGARPQLESVSTDAAEKPSDRFMTAMKAAARTSVADRSAEPMLAHLGACTSLNKTEVLGALKLMSTARRVNKSDRDKIIIAMLRTLSRLGPAALDVHMASFEVARDILDSALCNLYNEGLKHHIKTDTWLQARWDQFDRA